MEPKRLPTAEDVIESRLPPDERLEQLKEADLDTLLEARADAMRAAQVYSERIPEYRRLALEAYEQARLNSPEARAMQQQILDLESSMREYLAHLPEVAQYHDLIREAEQGMLAELQLRTTLGVLIGRQQGMADGVEADDKDFEAGE